MPRGAKVQVRDLLLIWDYVAKGIRSPTEIKRAFEEKDERPISIDTIRNVIGDYEEFLRLLPEYPELHKVLQVKGQFSQQLIEHWEELADTAKTLSINLEIFKPSILDVHYIGYAPEGINNLINIDGYLATCLLGHLKGEFPNLFMIEKWQEMYAHEKIGEFYGTLILVAHRKTFQETRCPVCKNWG